MKPQTLTITLPLSEQAVKAVVLAAKPLGIEPWELAVFALEYVRCPERYR